LEDAAMHLHVVLKNFSENSAMKKPLNLERKIIRDFDVKDLQITNDGSIFLLAENKFAKATAGKVRGFTKIVMHLM
jgi:hypothetical protein